MKLDTWYQKIWFVMFIIAAPIGAVGLGLAIGFGIQYGEQNYFATSWKQTTCHVADIGIQSTYCRGGCYKPVWTVWYLDDSTNNVTTVCEFSTFKSNSMEGAVAEAQKYPPGSENNLCRYNPLALQECRMEPPNPETPKIVLIVCMAALVPFSLLVYLAQLFIASHCFRKSYWSYC